MSLLLRTLKPFAMRKMFQRILPNHNLKYHKSLLFNSYIYQTRFFATQDVTVPNLGDSITEGTIVNILKNVGDKVSADEVILEIETDKVTVDIRAPSDGYIAKFYQNVESDVEVGAPIYSLSDEPIDGANISPPSSSSSSSSSSTTTTNNTAQKETQSSDDKERKSEKTQQQQQQQQQQQVSQSSNAKSDQHHRTPMIQFRYGDRAAIDAIVKGTTSPFDTPLAQDTVSQKFEFFNMPNEFQRKAWNDDEIDAVNLGGADVMWSK